MEKIDRKTVEKMTQQLMESMRKRRNKNLNEKMKNDCKTYTTMNMLLNDTMLRNKKYDIFTLEKNIHNLSMNAILYTQNLTAEFCVKYILNEDYASCVEDTYICIGEVLRAQKHLTLADIQRVYYTLGI